MWYNEQNSDPSLGKAPPVPQVLQCNLVEFWTNNLWIILWPSCWTGISARSFSFILKPWMICCIMVLWSWLDHNFLHKCHVKGVSLWFFRPSKITAKLSSHHTIVDVSTWHPQLTAPLYLKCLLTVSDINSSFCNKIKILNVNSFAHKSCYALSAQGCNWSIMLYIHFRREVLLGNKVCIRGYIFE